MNGFVKNTRENREILKDFLTEEALAEKDPIEEPQPTSENHEMANEEENAAEQASRIVEE